MEHIQKKDPKMTKKKLTRRQFIKTAAGTIAAPYIIKSTALGNSTTPPPSRRVTLGHIGVGGQGSWLLNNFLQLQDCQSVAVCDPFKSRRDKWANQIGCVSYNDFRELLARDDIDGVVIATPDHWHVPIGIAAAKAGKDMYIEKPLGLSITENQAIRRAVNRFGRVFQYGTQQRSGRNFRFACELARNERIGKLHTIHAWCDHGEEGGSKKTEPVPEGFDYDLWLGPAPKAPFNSDRCMRTDHRKGGYHISDYALGFIAGWGAHPLDIAQWGNDTDNTAPVEYEGTGVFPKDGLYDTATDWDLRCQYTNGVKMRFMSDRVAKPIVEKYHPHFVTHGTTFIGSTGWVSVDRVGIYADPPSLLTSVIGSNEIHLYDSNNHYKNFVDCIKSRADAISPINAAIQSDIISQLSDIAIRTSRKIRWDPKKEIIIDDKDASRFLTRSMRSPWRL